MAKYFFHNKLILVLTAVVFTTAFFGCNTLKRAAKQQDKIAEMHPIVLADKCNEVYPCIVIKGNTITVIDSTDFKAVTAKNKRLNDSIGKLLQQLPKVVVQGCEQYQDAIDVLKAKLDVAPSVIYRTKTITDTIIDTRKIALINNNLIELQKINQSLENSNAILKGNEKFYNDKINGLEKDLRKTKFKIYGSWIILGLLIALYFFLKNKLKYAKINIK